MANENSIDVYHALMALEEKVTGTAPDPENVTTDVALALADIFRTDVPMAQETAIVNAIDTITANYSGGGGVDVGPLVESYVDTAQPVVGSAATDPRDDYIWTIEVGGTTVSKWTAGFLSMAAAGTTIATIPFQNADTCDGYVTTLDDDDQYATVTAWDGTITAAVDADTGWNRFTFTMPELQEGEVLVLYPHTAD